MKTAVKMTVKTAAEEAARKENGQRGEKKRKGRGIRLGVCMILLCALFFGGCGKMEGEPSAQEGNSMREGNSMQGGNSGEEGNSAEDGNSGQDRHSEDGVNIRIGSLKGPTSMGILFLMERAAKGETASDYEFQMATGADELLPLMVKGDLDIALVPANVAAVLYQKTDGGVTAVDINTLGVLYFVTGTGEIASITDLKGKTIYLTGKGTTPEASLKYVLQKNGLAESDYTLEFKSEAAEVAAVLAENPSAVGLLPQPFVTAACMQNEALWAVLDMNEEWVKVQGDGSGMVTGVTVVRKEFLQQHEEAVKEFLEEHRKSAESINQDAAAGAALAVKAGIVAKEPIAQKAIPECNITCITGQEMKQALSEYLKVLADFKAELVGGAMPGEDFYYLP